MAKKRLNTSDHTAFDAIKKADADKQLAEKLQRKARLRESRDAEVRARLAAQRRPDGGDAA